MKQVLIFHTGETTCSEPPSYPGSMCPFVFARRFGTEGVCRLFGDVPLDDVDGWLQRLPECVAKFHGAHDELMGGGFGLAPHSHGAKHRENAVLSGAAKK